MTPHKQDRWNSPHPSLVNTETHLISGMPSLLSTTTHRGMLAIKRSICSWVSRATLRAVHWAARLKSLATAAAHDDRGGPSHAQWDSCLESRQAKAQLWPVGHSASTLSSKENSDEKNSNSSNRQLCHSTKNLTIAAIGDSVPWRCCVAVFYCMTVLALMC